LDVVAKERDIAPMLSKDAWQMIADVAAYQQGFTPLRPQQHQLKPRAKQPKRPLVKQRYSRVMVKFVDHLQVRLDVHNKPTSKSGLSVQTIRDLLDSTQVSLSRSTHNSVARVEALLKKAERLSRRQQPDLEGVYWLEGEETSVDAAAEMLWTMNEVEYIYYKPVHDLQPKIAQAPRPIKTNDLAATTLGNQTAPRKTRMTGACLFSRDDCQTQITERACINQGGTFLGVNSICQPVTNDFKSGNNSTRALGPIGECCLLTGCVAVVDETGCTDLNGIYLGANEDDPPDPCGDSQTDCPAGLGGGPTFDDYDACSTFGDYISYFTGDCYIDQTFMMQTERAQANPFPIGCNDTDGTLGGPTGSDFIVITGAPTNFPTNVFNSSCCTDVSETVPYCETNAWGTICANYANDPVFRVDFGGPGLPCERGSSALGGPNPREGTQPFGPTQNPTSVQPRIDMENLATTVSISNDGDGGAVVSSRFEIIYFDDDSANPPPSYVAGNVGKYLLLYQNGSWGGGPPAADFDKWLDPTENNFTALQTWYAVGGPADNGWVFVFDGELTSTSPSFLATQPLTNVFTSPATVFATPTMGNPPPAGWPGFTRTSTTPDYAEMGLLAWMSEEAIPWLNGDATTIFNPNPLPILTAWDPGSAADLVKVRELNQLLAWPMGGAQTQRTYTPPMSSPTLAATGSADPTQMQNYSGVGQGFSGNGINLFPKVENPGGFGGGTTERYSGAYGLGDLWVNNNGGTNGAYGMDVRVAVIDYSAYLAPNNTHEDLEHVLVEGPATGNDPLTLVFDETLDFRRSADHGTAVLGVIGASWGPNSAPGVSVENRLEGNVGVLGMAPDAELSFFPLKSEEQGGRLRDPWENAMYYLEQGDIICAAYIPYGISDGNPNLNFDPIVNDLMGIATDLGICVVIRAGDGTNSTTGSVDLLGLLDPDNDQNTIVASAVTPGDPYKRWADSRRASNYTGAGQSMTDLCVSGWGTGVTTCGKGPLRNNFLGYYTTIYDDPTDVNEVNSRSYTNCFTNTSAAAAQAAGALAIIQGFTKQFHSLPMGPPMARWLLGGGIYGGTDKDGVQNWIATPVDTENSVDSNCGMTNTLTWDYCDAGAYGGYLTGNFVNPRESMQNVSTNPIYETPNIEEIIILRGEYMDGINESLSLIDNNFYVVMPEETTAHVNYPVPLTVPGGTVNYRGNGKTTDIYFTGNFEALPPSGTIDIDVTHLATQASRLFSQFYMWDYYLGGWRQAAATAILPMGSTTPGIVTVERAARFVDPTTFDFHLRVITQDIGNANGGPNNPWPIYYDRILINPGGLVVPLP